MPRIINDDCISCGACAGECPTNAIAEGKGKYEVNESECIDCGACDSSCPVEAIKEK